MATIYYTKRFDSGVLKGLRSSVQSLTCLGEVNGRSEVQRCADAVYVGKRGKDIITGTRYTIVDASFQNYARS